MVKSFQLRHSSKNVDYSVASLHSPQQLKDFGNSTTLPIEVHRFDSSSNHVFCRMISLLLRFGSLLHYQI